MALARGLAKWQKQSSFHCSYFLLPALFSLHNPFALFFLKIAVCSEGRLM